MKFRIEGMTCGHCVSTLSRAAVEDVQCAIEAAGYSAQLVDRVS